MPKSASKRQTRTQKHDDEEEEDAENDDDALNAALRARLEAHGEGARRSLPRRAAAKNGRRCARDRFTTTTRGLPTCQLFRYSDQKNT